MQTTSIHLEAIDRILSAIYPSGDQLLSSFMFGKPGSQQWERRVGAEIFCRNKDYIQAILYVRQRGAPYLRDISVDELRSMVTKFITENYWHVASLAFTRDKKSSYAVQSTNEEKLALANALASSILFQPVADLTLYPLLTVDISVSFDSKHFFFRAPAELSKAKISNAAVVRDLDPTQFPPLKSWEYVKWPAKSWLGVRAPSPLVSQKMASAVLGALALVLAPHDRYSFSMRKVSGGTCTILNERWVVSPSSDPHTPPLMNNLVLSEIDHGWLEKLSELLDAEEDKQSASKIRSLEYFYRAWFLQPRDRFPILCMSLDSLVGPSTKHTSAAIAFVKEKIGTAIDSERLQQLMRIRGAVIHGAAPDVSESVHYEKYYLEYNTDPIHDLELIVAKCMRMAVFGAQHTYHPYSNQGILEELRAQGKVPTRLDCGHIIPDNI